MNLVSEGNISSSSVLTTRAAVNQYFSVADKSCPTYHLLLSQLQPEKSVTQTLILAVTVDVFQFSTNGRQISPIISVTAFDKGASQESKLWLQKVIAIKL